MSVKPIVKFPMPVLKSKAKPVKVFDAKLRRLVDDMIDTMYEAPGVGLAAPQIGVPLQVAVIAGQVTQPRQPDEEDGETEERSKIPPLVLVNPRIVAGEGRQVDEEGCLSVRDYCSNVQRFTRIQVEAQDLDGQPLAFTAEDFFARVIQHEIDHLEGTLFIDRISSLKRTLYRKKLKKILQAEQEES